MAESPTQEQVEQIAEALAGGKKIQAIKLYREITGLGLKEAKEFIDALIPKLKEQDPEKYGKLSAAAGSGCASVVLLCVGITTAVLMWLR